MDYTKLAGKEAIEKTLAALDSRGIKASVVDSKEEALAMIKKIIPAGASIMNGSSTTLEQIGLIDYLKEGGHGWNNLHEAIIAENDPAEQAALRRHSVLSEYYLGSVHALAESGEIIIASNTGSQLPHLVYTSPNIILVVSTKKIVPTLADAYRRLYEHVVPLEERRMQKEYGFGTDPNKVLLINGENTASGRRLNVILVREDLGF